MVKYVIIHLYVAFINIIKTKINLAIFLSLSGGKVGYLFFDIIKRIKNVNLLVAYLL